jgi:hypothetical protein
MSGARERAYAVIKYEPYIRPPGSLRRDFEARESWREMWERCCEGDAKSKWRSGRGDSGGVKVVDRDWLEWCLGRDDDESGGVEGQEKGISESGGDEKVGEGGEGEQREGESASELSDGGQNDDIPSREKDGSSELHDFGRLEKYLTERFDQVFPKEALE